MSIQVLSIWSFIGDLLKNLLLVGAILFLLLTVGGLVFTIQDTYEMWRIANPWKTIGSKKITGNYIGIDIRSYFVRPGYGHEINEYFVVYTSEDGVKHSLQIGAEGDVRRDVRDLKLKPGQKIRLKVKTFKHRDSNRVENRVIGVSAIHS